MLRSVYRLEKWVSLVGQGGCQCLSLVSSFQSAIEVSREAYAGTYRCTLGLLSWGFPFRPYLSRVPRVPNFRLTGFEPDYPA